MAEAAAERAKVDFSPSPNFTDITSKTGPCCIGFSPIPMCLRFLLATSDGLAKTRELSEAQMDPRSAHSLRTTE